MRSLPRKIFCKILFKVASKDIKTLSHIDCNPRRAIDATFTASIARVLTRLILRVWRNIYCLFYARFTAASTQCNCILLHLWPAPYCKFDASVTTKFSAQLIYVLLQRWREPYCTVDAGFTTNLTRFYLDNVGAIVAAQLMQVWLPIWHDLLQCWRYCYCIVEGILTAMLKPLLLHLWRERYYKVDTTVILKLTWLLLQIECDLYCKLDMIMLIWRVILCTFDARLFAHLTRSLLHSWCVSSGKFYSF
jgi:hypothetical protein